MKVDQNNRSNRLLTRHLVVQYWILSALGPDYNGSWSAYQHSPERNSNQICKAQNQRQACFGFEPVKTIASGNQAFLACRPKFEAVPMRPFCDSTCTKIRS